MTVSRSPDGAKRNPGTNDGPTPDCASLHPGYSRVICPTGYFVSSARDKNISLPRLVETALLIPLSRPTEGRIAIVTNAGRDAVDAAALGAQRDAGRVMQVACERSNGERTRDVAAYGEVVWS